MTTRAAFLCAFALILAFGVARAEERRPVEADVATRSTFIPQSVLKLLPEHLAARMVDPSQEVSVPDGVQGLDVGAHKVKEPTVGHLRFREVVTKVAPTPIHSHPEHKAHKKVAKKVEKKEEKKEAEEKEAPMSGVHVQGFAHAPEDVEAKRDMDVDMDDMRLAEVRQQRQQQQQQQQQQMAALAQQQQMAMMAQQQQQQQLLQQQQQQPRFQQTRMEDDPSMLSAPANPDDPDDISETPAQAWVEQQKRQQAAMAQQQSAQYYAAQQQQSRQDQMVRDAGLVPASLPNQAPLAGARFQAQRQPFAMPPQQAQFPFSPPGAEPAAWQGGAQMMQQQQQPQPTGFGMMPGAEEDMQQRQMPALPASIVQARLARAAQRRAANGRAAPAQPRFAERMPQAQQYQQVPAQQPPQQQQQQQQQQQHDTVPSPPQSPDLPEPPITTELVETETKMIPHRRGDEIPGARNFRFSSFRMKALRDRLHSASHENGLPDAPAFAAPPPPEEDPNKPQESKPLMFNGLPVHEYAPPSPGVFV